MDNLIWAALLVLSGLLGAAGRRIAGGSMNQWVYGQTAGTSPANTVMGDTPARLIYALFVTFAALMAGVTALPLAILFVGVFVGTTTGNFSSLSMGRGQYSFAHDFWGMTAHGALTALCLAPLMLLLPIVTPIPILMAGLSAALWYILGNAVTGPSSDRPTWPVGLQGSTEIAEATWGAAIGIGAFLCGGF